MLTKRVSREELVARLRESRKEYEKAAYKDGKEAGYDYAERRAKYKELIAIAKSSRLRSCKREDLLTAITEDAHADGGLIFGDDYEPMSNRDFLRGFVDGAMEVWKNVREDVEA